ncbi:unnamed protein product, partial [Rotaria sp. Silwood2]
LPSVCKIATANTTYSVAKAACSTPTAKAVYSAGIAVYSAGTAVYSWGKAAYSIVHKFFWPSSQSDTPNAGELAFWSDVPAVAASTVDIDYEERIAKKYIEEAMHSSAVMKLETMLKPRKRPLDNVASILRDVVESSNSSSSAQEPLSAAQLSSLVNAIKPYIYGDTPMCEALGYALEAFQSTNHTSKVVFVLSDGESKDGNPVELAERLHHSDVIVFACLLTSKNISQPRRLYDAPDPNWSKAQHDMFAMSSIVSNTCPAMAILLKKHWKLPDSGQSRLFLHANHPQVIHEFSSIVREMAESNDALLDMLGYVSIDMYINIANAMFDAKQQKDLTCYANALAAVFHLAMCRIGGRESGVPHFFEIRDQLIQEYGGRPTKTEEVLNKWAPFYRLRYKKVEELEARQAINARRPLVATFRLSQKQWEVFGEFYKNNPHGILQARDLQTENSSTKTFGHAVVLMRCDATSLTFMNSWGTRFANGGFF